MPSTAIPSHTGPPPLEAWGLVVVDDEPVTGGLDPDARVWQVRDSTGDQWAVKSTRRDCRFGLALAASLDGGPGVIAPLPTLTGGPWSRHEGRLVSVSPWLVGDDAAEGGRGLDDEQWARLGAVVRRIHEQRPPAIAEPVRRGVKRAGRRARARLRDLDDRFSRDDGRHTAVADTWRQHRDRLRRLESTALLLKETRRPTTRVCCHGDPHLGNVVVASDGSPWLIDLDEATVAPREVDLVLVELGVLPGIPVAPEHRAAFHSGYGGVDLDDDRITRFGCIRALEDVTTAFCEALDHPEAPLGGLDDLLGPSGLIALVEHRTASVTAPS